MSTKHLSLTPLLSLLALAFAQSLPAQNAASSERQVQQLFEQRCAECHGRDLPTGKRKGNKQMFLDATSTLVELNTVKALILGNPADSSIIQKVLDPSEDDRMPPKGDRLTTAQVALLRQWIAGNTPDTDGGAPPSTAIKRADLFRAALADLQDAPASRRRHFRYLTLHNLRNAGDSVASLRADRAAVSKTLNSLSTEPRIAVPVALGTDQVLLRFDLRDYGWEAAKWDLLAAAYPYEIEPALPTKTERDTRQATGTALPIIRADWFVFAATQPPFYEQLLAAPGESSLPNSDTKLEQQLGLHALQNIRAGRVQRAAFTDSGVSDSNRMIERHALAGGGYYWKSYDFANERGAGDLIRNPLGPPEANYRRAFQHDGGEIIWSLPNGMQGYLLSTAKGDVIARGPTGIVKDPDGPQGAVMNGVSCMRCHSAGMRQPKGREANVASTHRQARGALGDTEQRLFDRLYADAGALTGQLNDDGARFKAAARRAGVTEEAWFTQAEEPVSRLYGRFKADITARTLASELDLDPAEVRRQLREYEGAGNAQMNSLLQRLPRGIKRQNFIADFALLGRVFNLGTARTFRPVVFEEFRETGGSGSGNEFVNSLGMKFVSVPGTDVLFSIWETRKQDYEAYAKSVPGIDTTWQNVILERGIKVSFAPNHPVVEVSWDNAKAFCAWLTAKERKEGKLLAGATYRLPTDLEWSAAVGLPKENGATPKARDKNGADMDPGVYPWHGDYPPKRGAGNYNDITSLRLLPEDPDVTSLSEPFMKDYDDGYATTSPVGSFPPNMYGLFDMGGNVAEMCEDFYDARGDNYVTRGSSFIGRGSYRLRSTSRTSIICFTGGQVELSYHKGFRCVLVGGSVR